MHVQVVCSSPRELVRPVVTDQGPLAIVAGRHPLLEQLVPQGSFQVISGPVILQ